MADISAGPQTSSLNRPAFSVARRRREWMGHIPIRRVTTLERSVLRVIPNWRSEPRISISSPEETFFPWWKQYRNLRHCPRVCLRKSISQKHVPDIGPRARVPQCVDGVHDHDCRLKIGDGLVHLRRMHLKAGESRDGRRLVRCSCVTRQPELGVGAPSS